MVHFKTLVSTSDYGKISAELNRKEGSDQDAFEVRTRNRSGEDEEDAGRSQSGTSGEPADIPTWQLPKTHQSVESRAPQRVRQSYFTIHTMHLKI